MAEVDVEEIAREWAVDYKPWEDDLDPQAYAEYGFIQGYQRSQDDTSDVLKIARALRDWIDAVPKDVVATLPTMPGVDREWVDEVLEG